MASQIDGGAGVDDLVFAVAVGVDGRVAVVVVEVVEQRAVGRAWGDAVVEALKPAVVLGEWRVWASSRVFFESGRVEAGVGGSVGKLKRSCFSVEGVIERALGLGRSDA